MGDVVDLNGRSLGCAPPGQRPGGRPRRTDTSSLRVGSRRCTPRASSSVSGPASRSHRSCEFRHRQTAVEPMPTNGDLVLRSIVISRNCSQNSGSRLIEVSRPLSLTLCTYCFMSGIRVAHAAETPTSRRCRNRQVIGRDRPYASAVTVPRTWTPSGTGTERRGPRLCAAGSHGEACSG
jgi:hypothetical protein